MICIHGELSWKSFITRSCLCFSDGGSEEKTGRGAGEGGGESEEAEQREARFTDSTSSTAVSLVPARLTNIQLPLPVGTEGPCLLHLKPQNRLSLT